MTPAPLEAHQTLSMKLSWLINGFLETHPLGRIHAAPRDVRLSERLVYQPDLLYICNARRAISKPQCVEGAPDLIIEILSDSTRLRDTEDKFRDYQAHGVQEYWIMDPADVTASQYFVLEQGQFVPLLPVGHLLQSRVIPGLSIDLKALAQSLSG